MREIRTSGSEGGGANRPSLPLSREAGIPQVKFPESFCRCFAAVQ